MRIAILVHCFFPNHVYGTESYTMAIAKNLKRLGHEPFVISAVFLGEPRQERMVDTYVWEGIKVISIDKNYIAHNGVQETYYQKSMRPTLERIIRGIDPDVIHVTHLINHTASLLEVSDAMGIPTVTTLTDFYGFCYNNKLEKANGSLCGGPNEERSNCLSCYIKDLGSQSWSEPEFRKLDKPLLREMSANVIAKLYKRTPHLIPNRFEFGAIIQRPKILARLYKTYKAAIAPSKFLEMAYSRNMQDLPIKLSHFGIDIDRRIKPQRSKGSKIVFGYIGQIAPHKGVHLLVEAFNQLDQNKFQLEIFGDTRQSVAYTNTLKSRSSGFAVEFKGTFNLSEIEDVLSSIDVLVVPSTWYENSPLILLQALASHTPCIISNVEGMTEFVTEGVSGFYFKRGVSEDLFLKMKMFQDNPELARQMSATTNYNRSALDMAKDVVALYDEVAIGRRMAS